ncbi:hypothetical protein [Morganella morganii IS15]|nr:hypothetical protein CSB69_0138 [Morganella morganii]CDK64994.1 hypothetical protein [Morganella morganii IS15]
MSAGNSEIVQRKINRHYHRSLSDTCPAIRGRYFLCAGARLWCLPGNVLINNKNNSD